MQIRFSSKMKGSIDHKSYDDLLEKLDTATCATCGACEIMGTANTFQCLTEALGLSLPGSSNVPAYHSEKLLFARKTGKRVVKLVEEGFTALKVLTKEAVNNALMIDLAIGGSTNATLHLPAIANEIGFSLPLEKFNEYNKKIPTLCGIAPNGPNGINELNMAGGIPAVMKRLICDLSLKEMNISGSTIGEIAENAEINDENIILPKEAPFLSEGGTVILKGNLADDGAVVKQSAVRDDMRVFSGKARTFENEKSCLDAIALKKVKDGEVIIIRNVGPKGGPGMPEMLAVTMAMELYGYKNIAFVTDGRFSGATAGPCVGHVSPEAFEKGTIGIIKNGDMISINIPERSIKVDLSEEEIKERLKNYIPLEPDVPRGYMRRYIKGVGSASKGAVLT
jgi:dihydroxy-acid dehydratase